MTKSQLESIRLLREAREAGLTDAESWEEYVRGVAEDYGVSFHTAWIVFDTLGPSEAFDGFITELEDLADQGDWE